MTRLQQLHDEQNQSPWLDNLPRQHLRDGTLARLISVGVRGVKANPDDLRQGHRGGPTPMEPSSRSSSAKDAR